MSAKSIRYRPAWLIGAFLIGTLAFSSAKSASIYFNIDTCGTESESCIEGAVSDPFVAVTITESAPAGNRLAFSFDVSSNADPARSGDLLSVFFDVSDNNLLSGFGLANGKAFGSTGAELTGVHLSLCTDGSCTQGPENITPLVFEVDIRSGSGQGATTFVDKITFDLIHSDETIMLDLDLIYGERFGARLTSVSSPDVGEGQEYSLKIVGSAPNDPNIEPAPNPAPIPAPLALLGLGGLMLGWITRKSRA